MTSLSEDATFDLLRARPEFTQAVIEKVDALDDHAWTLLGQLDPPADAATAGAVLASVKRAYDRLGEAAGREFLEATRSGADPRQHEGLQKVLAYRTICIFASGALGGPAGRRWVRLRRLFGEYPLECHFVLSHPGGRVLQLIERFSGDTRIRLRYQARRWLITLASAGLVGLLGVAFLGTTATVLYTIVVAWLAHKLSDRL